MTHDTDDKFDAWLQEASAAYNAPPPSADVPREAMWRGIAAARAAAPAPRASRFAPRSSWALAAAAAVVLAVGIGIGRMLPSDTSVGPVATALPADSGVPSTYDVAAARHLTNAEAFVTAARMSVQAPGDTAMQRWARELLTDTRLLLDSPAGSDARRRALLEDLELLLVQVMELENSRTGDTNELLLDKTQHDQLLTRLRANVPAGPPARS